MQKLIVLLHGAGSSGDDLDGLGHFLQQVMPEISYVTPSGRPVDGTDTHCCQWFSPVEPAALLTEADKEAFCEMLERLFAHNGILPGRDQVMLLGFSQGATMALDTLVSGRFPLAGVIAFSGQLLSTVPWQPGHNIPVMLVHGIDDNVIPWTASEQTAATLTEAGVGDVETCFEPGVGHTIGTEGLGQALAFIARHFDLDDGEEDDGDEDAI